MQLSKNANMAIKEPDVARRTVKYVPVPQKPKPVKRYVVVYKPRLRAVDDPATVALAKSKAAKARQPQPTRKATERVDAAAVALAKIKAAKAKLAGGAR